MKLGENLIKASVARSMCNSYKKSIESVLSQINSYIANSAAVGNSEIYVNLCTDPSISNKTRTCSTEVFVACEIDIGIEVELTRVLVENGYKVCDTNSGCHAYYNGFLFARLKISW